MELQSNARLVLALVIIFITTPGEQDTDKKAPSALSMVHETCLIFFPKEELSETTKLAILGILAGCLGNTVLVVFGLEEGLEEVFDFAFGELVATVGAGALGVSGAVGAEVASTEKVIVREFSATTVLFFIG